MDGQSERSNQWLEQYLHIYGNYQQDDWAQWLPVAQYIHNSWPSTTTGQTLFDLLISFTPRIRGNQHQMTNIPEIEHHMAHLKTLQDYAQTAIRCAQAMTQKYTERKKGQCNFQPFIKSQLVWLEGTNLRLSHPTAKLCPKRFGPFHINKVISPCVYRLNLPNHWKIHNVFYASLLSPYTETPEHSPNYPEPPPELIDDQPEYEVEQVLGSQHTGCHHKLQYLLRWKGYSTAHDSWKTAAETNCPDLIQEFYMANPTAVRNVQIQTYINTATTQECTTPLSHMDHHTSPQSTLSYQSTTPP
jgi:Chromo (CHRromatin Organisation MOdifier) domain